MGDYAHHLASGKLHEPSTRYVRQAIREFEILHANPF